jgi:4-amino-4-deoxy-L-arabinose transferase-like glycosyltransferase
MTQTVLADHRTVWIVAALIIVLFATANLPWRLDDYDQAKQAFTSFEMIKEGHWLYQHTPHERVATKPPLVGWVSAALFAVTRSWEVAWRLPSLLAALAFAVVLFRAAKEAYGSSAALIALGAFGLNLLSPRLATLVRTDMPLALVIFLIGALIWQKIRSGNHWTLRDQVYVFVLLTAAMLIKGPIVYAFLLPGIAFFYLGYGRVGALRRPDAAARRPYRSAWPGWWPWAASFAIFLVWVVGGIRFQPGFYDEVVMREFMGRFGETIHRPQPLFFYLLHLLHKFAPWSVLTIAIALVDLRSRNWEVRSPFREMSPETFWLLCWSVGGLIAMSLISSKRVDRIFPVIPPLCLLLAAQTRGRDDALRRAVGAARRPYLWSVTALLFAMLFTGDYTGWKVITGYRDHRDAFAIFGRNVRREAEAHHWRYEVVSVRDEGLLLYLQKTHFIDPQLAVTEWNNGNLDAMVVSAEKATTLMPKLEGAVVSEPTKAEQGNYVLITH